MRRRSVLSMHRGLMTALKGSQTVAIRSRTAFQGLCRSGNNEVSVQDIRL